MKYFLPLFIAIIIIFHPWFSFDKTLSSGDWPYLYRENIKEFQIPTQPPFLWVDPYYQITAKIGVQMLHLTWDVTEKIFWFIPILILNSLSSWIFLKYMFRKINIKNDLLPIFGSFLYITNTYFLMLSGGGQMGVAVSYSIAPLVVYSLIKIFDSRAGIKNLIFSLITFSVSLMFDPRIFFITFIIFLVYFFFSLLNKNQRIANLWKAVAVIILSFALNLFWILPNVLFYRHEFSLIATEPLASFLSFATFPNSLSLLHPNWPENIFGKISFMRPEFIIIAIFAYLSLLFIYKDKKINQIILIFVFSGLLGSFLAKGVNEPFGQVYKAFSAVPGSSLFRDPTKFYLLIAISYSFLIPFSVYSLFVHLNKIKKYLGYGFILIVSLYFLSILKPAFVGQLGGTFSPHIVPVQYIELKNFIVSQNSQFNTLWIPAVQRFGFNSKNNNAIGEGDVFTINELSGASARLNAKASRKILKDENVKYIIVPYDSLHEIFISDRKYSKNLYEKTIKDLSKIKWLSLLRNKNGESQFGPIVVFEIKY